MDLPLSSETTLTEVAGHIKSRFAGSNLEGTLAYLRGPQAGHPTLVNQIARRILHSVEEEFWKDTLEDGLRDAPQPIPARTAKKIVNLIEAELRSLRAQEAGQGQQLPPTDFISLGKALAEKAFGACIYTYDAGEWFRHEDNHWVVDKDCHKITELAEEMILDLLALDRNNGDLKTAARSVETIVKRARSDFDISIKRTELDECGNCVNTPDGYYYVLEGDRDRNSHLHYCASITKVPPVEEWEGGVWDEFLQVLLPEKEQRLALQRMGAYILLGDRQDKAVFFLKGETNRGKSLLLNAIENALGEYAITTTTDLWLAKAKNDYEMADLTGKRLISCAEFDEDMRINTSLIKRFTGGEKVSARSPYGKPFRYKPQGTMVISTNKFPFLGSDAAAWGRMYALEFKGPEVGHHRFSWEDGRHRPLSDVLQSDEVAAEVLRWMMDGVEGYLETGIDWPEESRQVLKEEKDDQRHHAEIWIEGHLVPREDGGYTPTKDLWAEYRHWSLFEEGVPENKILTSTHLGRKLRTAGYLKNPSHEERGWGAEIVKRYIKR